MKYPAFNARKNSGLPKDCSAPVHERQFYSEIYSSVRSHEFNEAKINRVFRKLEQKVPA